MDNEERAIRTTYDELRAKERGEKPPVTDEVVAVDDGKPLVLIDESLDDCKPDDAGDFSVEATCDNTHEIHVDEKIDNADSCDTNEIQTDEIHPSSAFTDESKHLQPVSRILKPLSKEDEEAQRRISEFNALPPTRKITVLQEQLRMERARAAEAESELKRERELHHNTKYHSQLSISNLEGQVAELTTKVAELAKALGIDTQTA